MPNAASVCRMQNSVRHNEVYLELSGRCLKCYSIGKFIVLKIQNWRSMYDLALGRVRITIVAVEKQ